MKLGFKVLMSETEMILERTAIEPGLKQLHEFCKGLWHVSHSQALPSSYDLDDLDPV